MTKKEKLQKLKLEIKANKTLPLRETANNLVFGSGNSDTEILFIGEAPGYWEDQKGEPFVGAAGKLLDKTLSSIKLDRKDVFITNVVMYRPPNNRDPLTTELDAFDEYIQKIIGIIKPKLIVTLGRFSMAKFLQDVKISMVHGKLYKRMVGEQEVFVIPMFHPAAALRNGQVMQEFQKAFSRLLKALEKIKNL